MSGLLILGAGGHAKVVAETALASGVASNIAFLDDRWTGLDAHLPVLGWPVIGPLALALQARANPRFDAAVVAIGHAATRIHWIKQLQAAGYHLPVLLHHRVGLAVCPARTSFCRQVAAAQTSIGTGAILVP